MKDIREIEGKEIRLSAGSITIINQETGKTAGVVRNVRRHTDLPLREQIAYRAPRDINRTHVVLFEGKLYYIYSTRLLEQFKKYDGEEVYEKYRKEIERAGEAMECIAVRRLHEKIN